jgi:carbamoyltransferase
LSMPNVIVGLGGLLSDPACCVIKDGHLAAAVEQANVSRQDRPGSFPDEAFALALEAAGVKAEEVQGVALARPFAIGEEGATQIDLRARFPRSEILVVEHHLAHAASAFYASGMDNAAVLSIDRAGDFRSGALFQGDGSHLRPVREMYFPDSLGDLFNRVTEMLGYEPRADEHKVQWLSASGQPIYAAVFRKVLHSGPAQWPRLDRSYFDADHLMRGGFSRKFYAETEIQADQPLSQAVKADLASSLQNAVEETVCAMLMPAQNVCIAGGLGLNALLIRALEAKFGRVFVQPAAGNAGTALGAALHAWHNFYGETKRVPFDTLCLGPSYAPAQIKAVLENCKLRFQYLLTEGELIGRAIDALKDNKIVAWMQGRMEFGPRALGNRSILASPLNKYSTENLNVYIKHRESYRKFAASVPQEHAGEYFEAGANARYLATVAKVKPQYREMFSAALLGRDLIRVHLVDREENPLYHSLLTAAGKANGLPVLYNTSFNLFGDPLVCTPRDAVRSFYSSGIDALFVGSFYLEK